MSQAVRRGIAWTGVAGVALGVLDVVATLLLLRWWLTPAEYGVAALATPLVSVRSMSSSVSGGSPPSATLPSPPGVTVRACATRFGSHASVRLDAPDADTAPA